MESTAGQPTILPRVLWQSSSSSYRVIEAKPGRDLVVEVQRKDGMGAPIWLPADSGLHAMQALSDAVRDLHLRLEKLQAKEWLRNLQLQQRGEETDPA